MKALSLWEPWASAIALGLKRCETRHWPTFYRGPLAIHAAKSKAGREDYESLRELGQLPDWFPRWGDLPFGSILCVGTLIKVGRTESIVAAYNAADCPAAARGVWEMERWLGNYTPGRYGWLLDNVRKLPEPIPFKGAQGLFEVPDELVREVAG